MKKPALNIREGEYYKRIDGYVIRFDRKERDGRTIHGVLIYDHTENTGNTRLTMAKSGTMETTADGQYLQFTLFDGHSYVEEVKERQHRHTRPFSRVRFDEQIIRFDLSSFEMRESDERLFAFHEKNKNLTELQAQIDTLHTQYTDRVEEVLRGVLMRYHFLQTFYQEMDSAQELDLTRLSDGSINLDFLNLAVHQAQSALSDMRYYARDLQNREAFRRTYEREWHRRFANPLSVLLLFFVGAPLGAIIRRGGLGMPVVMAVLIFVTFFAVSMIGERAILLAWRGVWMSTIIFAPIGLLLLVKATTDGAFLDADVWRRKTLNILRKPLELLEKKTQ
jgi:lipopolysaccharide export system permease protein